MIMFIVGTITALFLGITVLVISGIVMTILFGTPIMALMTIVKKLGSKNEKDI